jgi:hypothetical protein
LSKIVAQDRPSEHDFFWAWSHVSMVGSLFSLSFFQKKLEIFSVQDIFYRHARRGLGGERDRHVGMQVPFFHLQY